MSLAESEPVSSGDVQVLPTRSLHEHELVIQRHLNSFIEVANALLAIKANRLYREADHDTFEDYCQKRWQMSARRANQLIVGATIADCLARDLTEMGTMVPIPEVERQARPLSQVPANARVEVWRAAVRSAGGLSPTAAQVQAAVDAHLGIDRDAGSEPMPSASPEAQVGDLDAATEGPADVQDPAPASDRGAGAPSASTPSVTPEAPAPELAQHENDGEPAAPSGSPSRAGDLLDTDAELGLLAWRESFTKACKAVTRLKLYGPADVAAKAEAEWLDDLAGIVRNLNGWWAEIEELRQANRGLRVVNGGAR